MPKEKKLTLKEDKSGNIELNTLDLDELPYEKDKIPNSKRRNFFGKLRIPRFKKSKKKKKIAANLQEDLNKKKAKRAKNKRIKRIAVFSLAILLILGVVGIITYLGIVVPALKVKNSLDTIEAESEALISEIGNKDISNLEARFKKVSSELDNVVAILSDFEFLKTLNLTKGYYTNIDILIEAVGQVQDLVNKVLPTLTQILEKTGFTVTPKLAEEMPTQNSEDETSSFALVMAELPQYLDLYKSVEEDIIKIIHTFAKLDPNYIPSVAGINPAELTAQIKKVEKEFPSISSQVLEFLEYVPELIGANAPTRYMLILQNEAEMRSSGGIITAYGSMTIDKGNLQSNITLTDSWNLENYLGALGIDVGYRNIYGQLTLMLQGCGGFWLRAQDVGIYPDLKWTMAAFSQYYNQASAYDNANFPAYDHILNLNFTFAENLLNIIQPLVVEGFGVVTADTLFDFIKADTDDPSKSYSADRKEIIEQIANAAKEKFYELDIETLPKLVDTLVSGIKARDLAFFSPNPNMQAYFDKYGMSGEFAKEYEGDYFHLNEAQNCSLKLNKWVRNDVTQSINIAEDGSITRHVRVTWQQPQVYNDSLYNQYSPSTTYSYRAWVRMFMPIGTTAVSSDGLERSGYLWYYPENYYDEVLNKDVSDNIIQFDHRRFSDSDPIPGDELNVSYALPANLNYNSLGTYRLLIQKHPGKSWGEKYILNFYHNNNLYSVEFILDRDKVITYKDGIISVDNYDRSLDWLVQLVKRISQ